MTPFEFRLLDEFQRGFPLVPRPFATVAEALGATEEEVIAALAGLARDGAVSRVGAVFRPGAIGASTLAAMEVPVERLPAVAAVVSSCPGVSHNYEREHRINLWFVAAAADEEALDTTLAGIARMTRLRVLAFPLVEEYHIDLGFPLAGGAKCKLRPASRAARGSRLVLGAADRRLVSALTEGLALEPQPYRALAAQAGTSEAAVVARLEHWCDAGVIRRFGVVVRHRELGWRANAMAVWDVPDEAMARCGAALAAAQDVTLAYRRARLRPDWPYNVYCMVHGTERGAVSERIASLNRDLGLAAFPHAVLFSRTRFKQTGARVAPAPEPVHG